MNRFPAKETVEHLRKQYPHGTRVELVSMNDPYTKLKPGERGSVMWVDDAGTIHVKWDCGSTLGIVFSEDTCRIIESAPHRPDTEVAGEKRLE